MKTYTVHRHGAGGEAPDAALSSPKSLGLRGHFRRFLQGERDAIVLVKEGMSWPAACFTVLWAMWHRLWALGISLVALEVALAVIIDALDPDPVRDAVLIVAFLVLVGSFANDARRRALAARGYGDAGVVLGDSIESAALRYFASVGAETGQARP